MLSTIERVLFLKSVELFSQVPGEDLAQVALIASEELRDMGDDVFLEGDPGDSLYLVLEGKVRVHSGGKTISELGARECFGEMAILDAAPRSASVTAISDTSLLKVSREDFQDIMAEKPQIASGIIRVLTRRLRDSAGS
jgi:CRP-like cAMP-binding protein